MTYIPKSEADVSEAVKSATAPIKIIGGGTRSARHLECDVLSLAGVTGIVDYEPGALTMVARTGTTLSEIEATLAAENQRLAFEPLGMAPILGTSGTSTIGGVFATNASGSRRIQAGAARDFLLGVRFVDGSGTIVKNGGRVMKNVTGYDLVKLMAGSWGTLGIMTEVSFKVLPISESSATICIEITDPKAAITVMTASLNTPYDVTGAAFDPTAGCVYVRIEGFEKSVAYRSGALRDLFSTFGDVSVVDNDAGSVIWQNMQTLAPMQNIDGDLWRVSVKPTDGAKLIAMIQPKSYLMDWSGGLVWLRVPRGTDVRAAMIDIEGHAMCLIGDAPQFHAQANGVDTLARMIRAKFDPNAILNQGLMG